MDAFLFWSARFVLALPVSVYSAFVFSTFWRWFAVPLGVPEIGMAHAYGIMLLVGYIHLGNSFALSRIETDAGLDVKTFEDVLSRWFSVVVTITVIWGIGAIVHSLM